MFSRIILFFVLGASSLVRPDTPAAVMQVDVTPELRFRAKTFTRETDPVINPIPWVQFKEMLPEGTRVQKGDMVFHLDVKGVEDRVESLENTIEEALNSRDRQLAEMRKQVSELEDQRAEKLDAKAIQVARRTYLSSLPVEADIEIARGRLAVAQSRLAANEEELRKSTSRLEQELISPAMLEEDRMKTEEQRARTRYAEKMLEVAMRPADPKEIEVVEYRIRNLDLEIGKLENEIPIQQKILEIEAASQERRIADLKSQLAEKEAELEHEFLYAPATGVLIYSPQLKQAITLGGKASKGMKLAEVPRRESMALEGIIPEQLRHLFKDGDPAEIELNIYPNHSFRGRISSIAPFSRDAVEGEKPSGVKVVDVVVELSEVPDDLPIGVYGWVTLSTAKPVSGWAVPASWVRYRGGKAHISVNGKMQAVNGILHDGKFVLSSPHPAHESIQPEGEWTQTETKGPELVTDQFMATGELTPFESLMLDTPNIRSYDIQVAWLIKENIQVKKGDVLVRLDSQQLSSDLENRALSVQRRIGDRESAEEQLAIQLSEQEFQLESAENRIAIREREKELVAAQEKLADIAQAEMNLTQAKIQLKKAQSELERSVRNAEWTAESEREKLKRDLHRRTLELERAEIRMALAREGADELEISQVELELLRETAKTAELKTQHYRSLSRAQSHLRWRKAREEHAVERLNRVKKDIQSMEIKAPVDGLVKYLKVWDGVRQSKIKSGMKVWRGTPLLSISSADKLYVEVPIPERYIRHLTPDLKVAVRIPSEGGMQWNGHIVQRQELLEPANQTVHSQSLYGNKEAPQEQVLKVRILVDTGDETTLKPGAIAQIIFPFEK